MSSHCVLLATLVSNIILRLSTMQSQTLSLSLIVGASVSLVLMLVFNGLSGSGAAPSIFVGSVSETSHLYETSITPAGNTKFQERNE